MFRKIIRKPRIPAVLLTLSLLLSMYAVPVFAGSGEPVRDKKNNTAFITDKSAEWADYENYLANLTLSVNGTQVREPLDVVIVLDRSGSMDMEYIQGDTHVASCPCLNPDHFNYKPVEGAIANVALETNKDTILVENDGANTITVFNAEKDEWVVLDTTTKTQLYHQFKPETLELGAYHFKTNTDGTLKRISKWDTDDIRKKAKEGLWDHADAAEGCYDRWSEAKTAIKDFTEALLEANPNNRVSLVPFSIHDDEVVKFLNSTDNGYNYNRHEERQWLIDQGYFDSNKYGVTTDGSTLSGVYASKVSWTSTASDITSVLPDLFTTANTDYVYALSEAYEMLADRGETKNKAAVVFLSDGVPYPRNSANISFSNQGTFVKPLVEAITSTEKDITYTTSFNEPFWARGKGYGNGTARHSVDSSYVNNNSGVYSADGQGAQIVTVSYMLDKNEVEDYGNQYGLGNVLEYMASGAESYIEISTDAESSSAGHLSTMLLNSSIFPGGRESVLRDEISKYFYVNPDQTLPAGVTVEQDPDSGNDVLVWELGDIYAYAHDDEPTITVELILKEEYRADKISKTTYYPTNADSTNKGQDIYDPEYGPDDPDTGAKLYYTDPDDNPRYDTIGTPKLPVIPTNPGDPTPVTVQMPTVRKTITGDIPFFDAAFTFTMTAANTASPMPANSKDGVKTVSISGNGTASLGSIVYTEAGTHVYRIRETNTGFTGYTYDTATYTLTVTVKENDGKLTATSTLVKNRATPETVSQAAFTNHYTSNGGDLTLYLSKRLTDTDGNLTGTGKPFGVHLYDEDKKLVSSVVLTANNGEVAVTGLQSGKTYYLIEEDWDYYTIEGYTYFETTLQGQKAFGFHAAQLPSGSSGVIRIQVNNSTEDPLLIPDDLVPLAPGLPEDINIIEINPETVPATGDNVDIALYTLLAILSGGALVTLRAYRKKSGNR